MARRVIATAEVQVAADVGMAEAGLEGLTESFRQIGQVAERAAERAEVAFFNGSRNMAQGLQAVENEMIDLLIRMESVSDVGDEMSRTFLASAVAIRKAGTEGESLANTAASMLRLFKEGTATLAALEAGMGDVDQRAEAVLRSTQEIEGAIRATEVQAERLGRAFRDVGQDIELAMAGGFDELQDEIRRTIDRVEDLGGEFRQVGRIGRDALNNIVGLADEELDQAAGAALRLARQLEGIESDELQRIERDAQQAAAAMNQMAVSANRADRSIDSIGTVARRTSGDVRGLVGLLGAAGLGYAAASAARFGLEMTQQLEKSEAAFLGLTGSVEGAADMLQRMVVFARETPYNLASVTEAAAQLLAVGDGFGVTATNIDQYLTSFGNAITITGGSEDQFIRIVRVLGQMSSTGKVLGQDMNQLAQNLPGYDVWTALAEGAGTSVQELRRLQDLGQLDNLLTGNEAVQILIDGMEGIPGAAGAMERRMNTLGGAIEKFKETAQLAVSNGLIPFSEEAQDILSDPVILNSVEDLSFAFGDLLSTALKDVRPELDDLAAAGENLVAAFESWAPALTEVVDALGDFTNFASAIIGPLGKATSAVLGFGDGLGKMGVAALAFAAGGPVGIAAGVVLGVSGAMDAFGGSAEDAAGLARLFAAAQGEVNAAMSAGEEAAYSEAQQIAIDTATELRDLYPDLVAKMGEYGIGLTELQDSLAVLATGTSDLSQLTPRMQEFFEGYAGADGHAIALTKLVGTYQQSTEAIAEEVDATTEVLAIAEADQIGSHEAQIAALQAFTEQEAANWEYIAEVRQEAADAAAETNNGWGELDEERTDAVRAMLEEQADAYTEWEADINSSTDGAAISLSSVAEEAENSARRIIDAINENSAATFAWQDNIVLAATNVQGALGLTDEQAQTFMGTLGEMGPAAAPAIASMIEDFNNGGTELEDFFNATATNAAVMSRSLTDEFDKATGAAPGLAEGLAEGTLTVEQILAELPAAMEAAGLDLESAAAAIDASDEMGVVGDQAVAGLVGALNSPANLARVRAATDALARGIVQNTERNLRVSSPSRVMYDIGEFVVEGLIGGIQDMSDETYAVAVQTASLISGGIEYHFRNAEKPQEEARKFAEDVAKAVIDELIAEQEAVADAAVALAEAAADALSDAWDKVKDRFKTRDLAESIADAQAELREAQAELASAQSYAGAGGTAALAAAERRVADANAALAAAEATDVAADLIADQTLTAFQRATEDTVAALQKQQEAETASIQARIDAAKRNLDPVARAAAEADLAATKERHLAEMTALERRREDEEDALQLRLDNENDIREAAIKAKEDEAKAFQDALEDVVDSIRDSIENMPALQRDVANAQRGVQDAFFDQFEELLDNVNGVDRGALRSIGLQGGLSATEVDGLIDAALASSSASQGATAAKLGVNQLIDLMSTGMYSIGANGALGIRDGLSSESRAIAEAMWVSVQTAIRDTLAKLEIRSPSRVTGRLIGEPMAEGIARGIMSGQGAVSSAMNGLIDNVVGGVSLPSASQLVDGGNGGSLSTGMYRGGPLVTMPGAIIQDATDADLVAQRVLVALSATGID